MPQITNLYNHHIKVIMDKSTLLWCQQHVVHRLETEPLWLLDHAHGTVCLSSSLTARHLSPSRNISRPIYLVYLFRAQFDCVKCPCSSLGRLRRSNFVILHYITLQKEESNWRSTEIEPTDLIVIVMSVKKRLFAEYHTR